MKTCTKCAVEIPDSTPGLTLCLPCHVTELNKFMTAPKTTIEINIQSLRDCSPETLHSYWTALTELNTRVKMFHDSLVQREIKASVQKKAAEKMQEVEAIRNQTPVAKKAAKQLTKEQKADAAVVKIYLKNKPTGTAEQILESMLRGSFDDWDLARVKNAIPFALEAIARDKSR